MIPRIDFFGAKINGKIPNMKTRRAKTEIHSNGVAPLLFNGDRLSQKEFHRRYELCPPGFKAELIGGIVYMPSPVRLPHGYYQADLLEIFKIYKRRTLGVDVSGEASIILGDKSEPQPDAFVQLLPEYQGQSFMNEDQYAVGAPELVGEISHSTIAIDLGQKKVDYERAGVQEYLVVCIAEQEIRWFNFPSRRQIKADKDGILKSIFFPGLWIDEAALLARNTARCVAVIRHGLASREHTEFVARLKRIRKKSK